MKNDENWRLEKGEKGSLEERAGLSVEPLFTVAIPLLHHEGAFACYVSVLSRTLLFTLPAAEAGINPVQDAFAPWTVLTQCLMRTTDRHRKAHVQDSRTPSILPFRSPRRRSYRNEPPSPAWKFFKKILSICFICSSPVLDTFIACFLNVSKRRTVFVVDPLKNCLLCDNHFDQCLWQVQRNQVKNPLVFGIQSREERCTKKRKMYQGKKDVPREGRCINKIKPH